MAWLGVEMLVVALAVVQSVGFILTYVLAVIFNHVTPDFPYISDTGGKAPESCVFTFVCNLTAFLGFGVIYIRYRTVRPHLKKTWLTWLNFFTFFVGILSVLGIMIVGAFQDDVILTVHYVGAMMVFGFGNVYMWLQTLITLALNRSTDGQQSSCLMVLVRLALSALATAFFIMTLVSGLLVHNPQGDDGIWPPGDTGFAVHVLSTSSEWALSICFLALFLTFHSDFRRISFQTIVKPRNTLQGSSWIDESSPLIT